MAGLRIESLPEVPLLKVAEFLDGVSLVALSSVSSKLHRFFSGRQKLWAQKVASENLPMESPRLLKKMEALDAVFPSSCLAKRAYLLARKIRQNVRTGNLKQIGAGLFQGYNLLSCLC